MRYGRCWKVTEREEQPSPSPTYGPADSLVSPRFTGPATFARLPLIRTLEDVDLAVVGVPFDTGVTYRVGGRFGPDAVRRASVLLRPYNPNQRIRLFDILSCVDSGDIAVVPGFTERSYELIRAAVERLVRGGVVPLFLGGDHGCTLPQLRGFRSRAPVAVIDFDSHPDAGYEYFGEKYNHGTWMRRAVEEGLIDVDHSIEVGLRGSLYDATDWTNLEAELGLQYLTTQDVLRLGIDETVRLIRDRVGDHPAYVSFDIDMVDPAHAPGTGIPEPGGILAREALQMIRGLAGLEFVGFDIMEVIPMYDASEQTAFLAANIGYEMMSLVASHRRGALLTD